MDSSILNDVEVSKSSRHLELQMFFLFFIRFFPEFNCEFLYLPLGKLTNLTFGRLGRIKISDFRIKKSIVPVVKEVKLLESI